MLSILPAPEFDVQGGKPAHPVNKENPRNDRGCLIRVEREPQVMNRLREPRSRTHAGATQQGQKDIDKQVHGTAP